MYEYDDLKRMYDKYNLFFVVHRDMKPIRTEATVWMVVVTVNLCLEDVSASHSQSSEL